MGSEELLWIKERQREFESRFSKKLHIDWRQQKGLDGEARTYAVEGRNRMKPSLAEPQFKITCTPSQYFRQCCEQFGVDPERIINPGGKIRRHSPERKALLKFVVDSYRQQWQLVDCAKIVNKTYSLLNYYLYVIYHQEKHLIGEA